MKTQRICCLSGTTLKLIAAVSMLIDHIGVILFPAVPVLRVIGRLAFPLFAFMIAEGADYTRNKLRYFLMVLVLGVLCQAVYFAVGGEPYMNVLITFAIAILLIYALQYAKRTLLREGATWAARILACALPILATGATYVFCRFVTVDYGFVGCTMPLLAALPSFRGMEAPARLTRIDTIPIRAMMLIVGLVPLCIQNWPVQLSSLLAIPLLFLYSGKRGRLRMKYFFYVFYPLHLALLYGIHMLILLF